MSNIFFRFLFYTKRFNSFVKPFIDPEKVVFSVLYTDKNHTWFLKTWKCSNISNADTEWFVNLSGQFTDERAVNDEVQTAYIDASWNVDMQTGLQTDTWSLVAYADNLLDDDTVAWGQGYQDFKDGMYGGANGGEPRDEAVMAFLPAPRSFGVRASWKF